MQRAVVVFSICILIVACSRTHLAYNNADWLLERYAVKTIDISADQREQWQPVLSHVLQRHHRIELPQLVAYLDLATHISSQTDPATSAACLVDGAMGIARRHAQLAIDLAVPLLTDLDTAQITHLREHMKQRQQELIERYLDADPEERRTKRQARFSDRIESWIGSMNDDQRQRVENALTRIPDLTPDWLAYREQQTSHLLDLLEAGASTETLEEYLNGWWLNREDRSPEYLRQWRIAKLEFIAFLDDLAPTLTPSQRGKLQKRLGKLRNELAGLLPADHTPVERMAADSTCPFAPA